ncbi:MAG: DUF3106 domain-containing protein [Planctomycetota bacterium]
MTAGLTRILVLSVLLVLFGSAQETAAQHGRGSDRWSELTEEQRAEVKRRFEQFKRMSPEEQEAIRERHRALEQARDKALADLQAEEARRLEQLPPRERKRAMNSQLRSYLSRSKKSILEGAGLPGQEAQQPDFDEVRRAMKQRAEATLQEFEEDGFLEPGQAEELLRLSPWELRRELRKLKQRQVLQNPPPELSNLSEQERRELQDLPPDQFMRRMHELHGRKHPRTGEPGMLEDALCGRPRHVRPVPEQVLLEELSEEQRAELAQFSGSERDEKIVWFLREKAAKALESHGQDPSRLGRLKELSRDELTRELMRIIHPRKPGGGRPDDRRPEGRRPDGGRPEGGKPGGRNGRHGRGPGSDQRR